MMLNESFLNVIARSETTKQSLVLKNKIATLPVVARNDRLMAS
jgi:hypothetical protein